MPIKKTFFSYKCNRIELLKMNSFQTEGSSYAHSMSLSTIRVRSFSIKVTSVFFFCSKELSCLSNCLLFDITSSLIARLVIDCTI